MAVVVGMAEATVGTQAESPTREWYHVARSSGIRESGRSFVRDVVARARHTRVTTVHIGVELLGRTIYREEPLAKRCEHGPFCRSQGMPDQALFPGNGLVHLKQ